MATLVATTMLAGCTATGGGGGRYVQSDAVCGLQRQSLASLEDTFVQDLVGGALAGAAAGALIAAFTDGNAVQGALIGATLGAAAGAYLNNLKKQHAGNVDGMLVQINGDLTRENREIARAEAAFTALMDCRRQEAASIRADHAAGRADLTTANTRLAAVRAKVAEDFAMADRIREGMGKRVAGFEESYKFIDPVGYDTLVVNRKPQLTQAAERLVASTTANVRATPSAEGQRVGSVPQGSSVEKLGKEEGWWHVRLADGSTGYVAERLLTPQGTTGAAAPAVMVATGPRPINVPVATGQPAQSGGGLGTFLTGAQSQGQQAAPAQTQTITASSQQLQTLNATADLTYSTRVASDGFDRTVDMKRTEIASLTQDIAPPAPLAAIQRPVQVATANS
ncbi:MAG: hypothetical protein RLY86_26 [Pseudomonadota bacterium]|jgi:uncharacterized protein YgiM (DUF1202 family)